MKTVRLLIVNFNRRQQTDPDEWIAQVWPLRCWVRGAITAGAKVTVFSRFGSDTQREFDGADYRFVPDRAVGPASLQAPVKLIRHVVQACEMIKATGERCVTHVNGLIFPRATRNLCRRLRGMCPTVVQHHAGIPAEGWRRRVQRWGLEGAQGFFFSAGALADDFRRCGLIRPPQLCYEVMEASSGLCRIDRRLARKATAMEGSPVLFWAGNLNANKDPLTVLTGLETILPSLPQARLYMAFREADLLDEVRSRIASSARLRVAVTLLGEIPYAEMAPYFSAADLFVQGSTMEGSGVALLDALACGAVPVVTDIPTFRILTGNGRVGYSWQPGRADQLARALRSCSSDDLEHQSRACREIYAERWSEDAIGRTAVRAYHELIERPDEPIRELAT